MFNVIECGMGHVLNEKLLLQGSEGFYTVMETLQNQNFMRRTKELIDKSVVRDSNE
ncbi:9819_t:CDS:2, partial [Dentiscutata heterogama]